MVNLSKIGRTEQDIKKIVTSYTKNRVKFKYLHTLNKSFKVSYCKKNDRSALRNV